MELRDKILVVEDDQNIANVINMVLNNNNYEVIQAKNGNQALTLVSSHCPDLVLLDLGLPDMDGLDIIRSIRKWSHMPIVVVSARTHEQEKVEALDLGADDYITKPFGASELLARIRTALRHTRTSNVDPEIAQTGKFQVGQLEIDFDKRQITVAGESVHLTPNEYKIMALLAKNAGRVLTYDTIIRELWGPSTKSDNQILRVNMANIRRKIEENPGEPIYVFTEAGVGYRMAEKI